MPYSAGHMGAATFREWLSDEIQRQEIPRRELARRLARKHPEGATPQTIETYRRAIYKYLDPSAPTVPTTTTRAAFAEVLGVDPSEMPASDDEEDSEDMAQMLTRLAREHAELSRQLTRALKAVQS